jgi:hypothetical protein
VELIRIISEGEDDREVSTIPESELTIGSGHSSDDLASEGEISDDDNLSPQNSTQAAR